MAIYNSPQMPKKRVLVFGMTYGSGTRWPNILCITTNTYIIVAHSYEVLRGVMIWNPPSRDHARTMKHVNLLHCSNFSTLSYCHRMVYIGCSRPRQLNPIFPSFGPTTKTSLED
ncbi:hypothetical protein AMTR_s00128p00102830 [Amborella trichopoda]|uniref:Uncharacterized protein n=1 Tax=Amborella trichopoda TaxID=13333 RepID=W1NMU5_AMBTC|nr:hypothetical protein AMTR_s00128p00102830 [Amborella trichopoda]